MLFKNIKVSKLAGSFKSRYTGLSEKTIVKSYKVVMVRQLNLDLTRLKDIESKILRFLQGTLRNSKELRR